jgi:hypothetical protein
MSPLIFILIISPAEKIMEIRARIAIKRATKNGSNAVVHFLDCGTWDNPLSFGNPSYRLLQALFYSMHQTMPAFLPSLFYSSANFSS